MFDKEVIKKSLIIFLVVITIITGIAFIRRTLSRYDSKAKSQVEADLAFWIVRESFQSKSFAIAGEIQPLPSTVNDISEIADAETVEKHMKEVIFTVSNHNEDMGSTVPMKYNIIIESTTYMPLEYELFELVETTDAEGNVTTQEKPCIITNPPNVITDSYGTKMKQVIAGWDDNSLKMDYVEEDGTGEQTDTFILRIKFPKYENDILIGSEEDYEENYYFADAIEYIKIQIDASQRVGDELLD